MICAFRSTVYAQNLLQIVEAESDDDGIELPSLPPPRQSVEESDSDANEEGDGDIPLPAGPPPLRPSALLPGHSMRMQHFL